MMSYKVTIKLFQLMENVHSSVLKIKKALCYLQICGGFNDAFL